MNIHKQSMNIHKQFFLKQTMHFFALIQGSLMLKINFLRQKL